MYRISTWLTAPALLALSFGANAGTVDLFDTDQAFLTDDTLSDGGESSSVAGGADILGGERDLFVELISSPDPTNVNASIGVSAGALRFSTDTQAAGHGQVQWDGPDGSNAIDFTGLGGVDLTEGGTVSAFRVDTIFADAGFEFVVTAFTDANTWTEISFSATGTPAPATTFIPFDAFTNAALCGAVNPAPGVNSITCAGGNTPVDLTNLGALVLDLDPDGESVSIDLTLDAVTTVPEPAVLGLLGAGLLAGGLVGFGRRRRA